MGDVPARCWDDVADGYEKYFVPRFRPWVTATVDALGDLPGGPILVPCCGTFPELPLLAGRFPDREIVGIDISPGMISRAQRRAAPVASARAIVQDAAMLDPAWSGTCAAVVSVFGLQQLPAPDEAIAEWVRALAPGGRLAVAFWPTEVDTDDPWGVVDLLESESAPVEEAPWERNLAAAVTAAGATIERDDLVAFPMVHTDGTALWNAMTTAGALRALALRHGPEHMERLRQKFLSYAPPSGEWRHSPRARLIVATR